MPMVDADVFDGQDVVLVYVVGRVREGKRVEQVLSQCGLDFAIDFEPIQRRVLGIIPVQSEGVGFYVLATHAAVARDGLRRADLLEGLIEEEPVGS